MFQALDRWLEHRTGLRAFTGAMLLEHVPGGAKWRYVWGSCLTFVFALQLFTGLLLMTAYSPSATSAWGSVYFIQYEMDFGWLIRGLHHFGSQMMVVLAALHMLQVVIAGAHLPPREFNWWLGMILLGIVLGLSLTGYLLPWDQKGYYATRVATNIAGSVPFIGSFLQKTVVGGAEYGNATLTRFFALHVAILPGLLIALLIAHVALFRRHGVTYPKHATGEAMFWPDQVFKDLIACLAVFGVMLFLVFTGHGHHLEAEPTGPVAADAAGAEPEWYEYWAKAGRRGLGANLDAPADPAREYPARPEWYFLFLFQLLKYFPGDQAIIGTVVIPKGIGIILLLLPLFGYGRMRPVGHVLGVLVVMAILAAAGSLTCLALADDSADPLAAMLLRQVAFYVIPGVAAVWLLHLGLTGILGSGAVRAVVNAVGYAVLTVLFLATAGLVYLGVNPQEMPEQITEYVRREVDAERQADAKAADDRHHKAEHFQHSLEVANAEAARSIHLAAAGIPEAGAVYLLRNDPQSQFQPLFMKHCASCHSYGEFPEGIDKQYLTFKTTEQTGYEKAKFTAADLAGFGSAGWIHELLKDPGAPRFYGRALTPDGEPAFTSMTSWVQKTLKRKAREAEDEGKTPEQAKAKVFDDFGKIAAWLATHPAKTDWKGTPYEEAYRLFTDDYNCISCHRFVDPVETGEQVDLTGYGSAAWLRKMLETPAHPNMYGLENRMPAFRDWQAPDAETAREAYLALINQGVFEEARKQMKDLSFADVSRVEGELLIRHLSGDGRVVFGGQPIGGVAKKE